MIWNRQIKNMLSLLSQPYTPDKLCVHTFFVVSFRFSRVFVSFSTHSNTIWFLFSLPRWPYKFNTQRFSCFIFSTQVISCIPKCILRGKDFNFNQRKEKRKFVKLIKKEKRKKFQKSNIYVRIPVNSNEKQRRKEKEKFTMKIEIIDKQTIY